MFKGSSFFSFFKNLSAIFTKNIKYKLFVIYVVIIAIPILFFGFLSYEMSSNVLQNDFIKYKQQLNGQIVKNIDENLKNLTRQSMSVYTNLDDILFVMNTPTDKLNTAYLQAYDRVANFFRSVIQSNDKIFGFTLISLNGEIKFYLDRYVGNLNLYNVRNEPWFRETLSLKGAPLLLEPHLNKYLSPDSYNRNSVISISRALIDLEKDNAFGILILDQDISQFSGIATNVEIDPEETIAIIADSSNIISANKTLSESISKIFLSITPSSAPGFSRLNIDGKEMLITYGKSDEFGWRVISMLPVSVINQKSLFLRNINLTLLIILIIFSFIISILISNFITIPLKKLMFSFKKLQQGDFDTRVSIKGDDELAQIGNTFNTMVTTMHSLIKQKYEIGILRKQSELESLQSQINPHFLYNTLSSIKAVINKSDFPKALSIVQNLSDIFRYNLNRGKYIVKLSDEIEHVKKYLFIQECRFAGKYEVTFDIDEEALDFDIIRFTLQPIIENALFHGIEAKRGKGEIKIAAKVFKDEYFIYISDNGAGIPDDELAQINQLLDANPEVQLKENPEKMGIYNVNARIKFHFGNEYGLKIISSQNINTTVKITLPALKNVKGGD
ncbi:MAG: cache domain-containing sensor histidine kinase [Saccharofermentanales bacterium]